jgi:hypothetical protein
MNCRAGLPDGEPDGGNTWIFRPAKSTFAAAKTWILKQRSGPEYIASFATVHTSATTRLLNTSQSRGEIPDEKKPLHQAQ